MKNFSFTLKQVDPVNVDLTVTTRAYKVEDGGLSRLAGVPREFTEEDIVDFDREVGVVVGISANDLLHGDSSVKVEEITVLPEVRVLKVIKVEEARGEPRFYLLVIEVAASGEERTLYCNHRSLRKSLNEAVKEVSKILGVNEDSIWSVLK